MKDKVKLVKFASLGLTQNYDETYAKLLWSIRMGYPRVTVYLDNKNFTDKIDYDKQILGTFNPVTLEILFDVFEKAIASKNGSSFKVDCLNAKYENGVKTNKIYLQGSVVIGKSDDGIIYISVRKEGAKVVNFDLMVDTRWFRIKGSDGVQIEDKATLSKLHAKAYLKILRKAIDSYSKDLGTVVHLDAPGSRKSGYKAPAREQTQQEVKPSSELDKAVGELDDMFKDE